MGNYVPKKATFTVKTVKGNKVYTPVNKRAHTVAHKLGKRTKVTQADINKARTMGSYQLYYWTKAGTLKAI